MDDSIEQPVVSVLQTAHKMLCNAETIAFETRQDFCLESDGEFMTPMHSKIGHAMRMHSERLASWYGRKQLMPDHIKITSSISF